MGESDGSTAELAFGVLLVALGVFGVWTVGSDVRTHLDNTGSTATVRGTVVGEPSYFETGTDDTPEYTVRVEYRYTVEGQTYTGSTVRSDGTNTFAAARRADEFVRSHPANSTVTVYYRPSNPEQSYLMQDSILGIVVEEFAFLIGGPVFFWLGWYFLKPSLGIGVDTEEEVAGPDGDGS